MRWSLKMRPSTRPPRHSSSLSMFSTAPSLFSVHSFLFAIDHIHIYAFVSVSVLECLSFHSRLDLSLKSTSVGSRLCHGSVSVDIRTKSQSWRRIQQSAHHRSVVWSLAVQDRYLYRCLHSATTARPLGVWRSVPHDSGHQWHRRPGNCAVQSKQG